MKSDDPTSFKDRLNQDIQNHPVADNDTYLDGTHHITRNSSSGNTILFISQKSKRSFSYSYLTNIGMDNKTGTIDVNFTSGKILIEGKNLNQLFIDLHRHKVADVDVAAEDIDDITIILNGEL